MRFVLQLGVNDSAGVLRHFLCKPKDDLRKDSRLMEFSSMVNRLLHQYPLSFPFDKNSLSNEKIWDRSSPHALADLCSYSS